MNDKWWKIPSHFYACGSSITIKEQWWSPPRRNKSVMLLEAEGSSTEKILKEKKKKLILDATLPNRNTFRHISQYPLEMRARDGKTRPIICVIVDAYLYLCVSGVSITG